ncbi:hypothetical protein ACFQS7_14695 [Dankookia sp. GCM10030260]|uniref:hypothetical protein n=1 Tax=Dankookia sp. GCM10030260 TaxID=3273390 RepID=UPI00361E09DA
MQPKRLDFLQEKILKFSGGHPGRRSRSMIIRVSPQWQVTIPKSLRARLGKPRQMEARIDRASLVLTPILMDSVESAERSLRPEGITAEVLVLAMDLVAARRRKQAAAASAAAATVKPQDAV